MKRLLFVVMALVLLVAACTPSGSSTPTEEATPVLRVMTHDSFSVSEEVIARFEQEHHVKVQFLQAGDAGAMLSQAILSRDNPQADVLYGVDNTFLSRALEADLFIPYRPQGLENVPAELQLDPQSRVVPVDYGDVCLNYDKAYFEAHHLAVPQDLADLTDPAYRGLLVVENPATSSPGLAFLIATVGRFGEEGYLDFWQALVDNDLRVVDGWETAYYTEFSGGAYSEGQRPLVVSYATSPAAEVYFSEGKLDEPPTGAVVAPQTCFRQIEFAGILRGTKQEALAKAFLDFLLSDAFQNDIPLQMWVFPASRTAELPPVFADYALEAEEPVAVPYAQIEAEREAWIRAWTEVVLH